MRAETQRPIVVVSGTLPDPKGPAAARLLNGFVVGARMLGHDVSVWSFWPGAAPTAPLPDWVRWEPLPVESWVSLKARALLRPRSDVAIQRWRPPDEVVAVAEEFYGYSVVHRHPRSVAVIHYSTLLDARALGWTAARVQDLRAECRAARAATVTVAYSQRVADTLPGRPHAVPCGMVMPDEPLPIVDEPVAACLADWRWPPNRQALAWLLSAWPRVRQGIPGARLLVGGRGDAPLASGDGVDWLGAVPDSADVLAQAAVLAFPCPPSSGPKVKVLEAAALGLPVVTTPAGIEGLALDPSMTDIVDQPQDVQRLSDTLIAVLRDPERRAKRAAVARASVQRVHSAEAAAATRLSVICEAAA